MNIPSFITLAEDASVSFGKKAFADWADSFQNSTFDRYVVAERLWYTHGSSAFSCWNQHGTYLCILGTNICAGSFLEKALALNPDMEIIHMLLPLYRRLNDDGFHTLLEMEGGFSIKPEVVKNKERMAPISRKIGEFSALCDEIIHVFGR